ncbi:hypothetical protein HBB16_13560 [Pseudonocardia sp. MCCB 268]|nr:hypothetical protein [Pseudonocardia cytotoxica]
MLKTFRLEGRRHLPGRDRDVQDPWRLRLTPRGPVPVPCPRGRNGWPPGTPRSPPRPGTGRSWHARAPTLGRRPARQDRPPGAPGVGERPRQAPVARDRRRGAAAGLGRAALGGPESTDPVQPGDDACVLRAAPTRHRRHRRAIMMSHATRPAGCASRPAALVCHLARRRRSTTEMVQGSGTSTLDDLDSPAGLTTVTASCGRSTTTRTTAERYRFPV